MSNTNDTTEGLPKLREGWDWDEDPADDGTWMATNNGDGATCCVRWDPADKSIVCSEHNGDVAGTHADVILAVMLANQPDLLAPYLEAARREERRAAERDIAAALSQYGRDGGCGWCTEACAEFVSKSDYPKTTRTPSGEKDGEMTTALQAEVTRLTEAEAERDEARAEIARLLAERTPRPATPVGPRCPFCGSTALSIERTAEYKQVLCACGARGEEDGGYDQDVIDRFTSPKHAHAVPAPRPVPEGECPFPDTLRKDMRARIEALETESARLRACIDKVCGSGVGDAVAAAPDTDDRETLTDITGCDV